MIKVSIIGATGYTGIELIRLLESHLEVEITGLISNSSAGIKITDIYPHLLQDSILQEYNLEKIKASSDIVFTALPHGISQKYVAELVKAGLKVIDLSGDYRYKDINIYEEWYGKKHNYSELAEKAVYGLPELNRELISNAELVANPGCYPTASLLGLAPLLSKKIIKTDSIIIDAKSGATGAGKSLKESMLFNEVDESIKAYNLNTHRHTSEIEYIAGQLCEKDRPVITFTPHLVPMKRGILATIYADISQVITQEELVDIYQDFYSGDGFVKIMGDKVPETKYVAGSNYCQLGFSLNPRNNKVIVVSVIDNLCKGASGQAVQNMNIMAGFEETMGLEQISIFP